MSVIALSGDYPTDRFPINEFLNSSQIQALLRGEAGDLTSRTVTKTVGPYGSDADYITDGVADDVQIQAAITVVSAAGGGIVMLRSGTYSLSTQITIYSNIALVGENEVSTVLSAASNIAAGNVIYGVDCLKTTIRDMTINGRGTASTVLNGIKLDLSVANNNQHIYLRNLLLQNMNGNGVEINTPIVTNFENIRVISTSGDGIYVYSGTSTNFNACYVQHAQQSGYHLKNMTYYSLNGCASETSGFSYYLDGSSNATLISCGSEVPHVFNATYPGTHYKISSGAANTFISCYARDFDNAGGSNNNYIDVQNSAATVEFYNFKASSSTNAPTYTYNIGGGSQVSLRTYSFTGLGSTLNNGTPLIVSNYTDYDINGTGTASFQLSRGAVTNFANYIVSTATTNEWAFGLRNDSTNDMHFRDTINARSPLFLKQSSTGGVGVGNQTSPTALLHINAGTATANTAPLKFTSGTKLTTAEVGAVDYNGNFYLTNAGILRFPVGGVLFDHYADVGNSTTTETDLYSDTTAANTLNGNGDKIAATYAGIFVSSGTATRELKVYFGGTVIFDSGALSISAGADAWTLNVIIVRDSGTTVRCSTWANLTGAAINAFDNYTAVSGLTLSSTNILKITGQAAGVGAASNDIVAKLGTVSFSPAA